MEPSTFSQTNVETPPATVTGVLTVADGIIFLLIFTLVCIIVWLSNREIKISQASIKKYQKLLDPERISLERRIAERTESYVHAEKQRMIELERNSEFGKLSRGLFHDLIGPLSSVSLYAQQLGANNAYSDNSNQTKEMIHTVIASSKRMNSFMESVRRSLGNDDSSSDLKLNDVKSDLQKEIEIVCDILGYKARMANVLMEVDINSKERLWLPIHPVRLHQLILNLVSNAIDACIESTNSIPIEESNSPEHLVTISVNKIETSEVELSVSDTGSGISSENMDRLFKKQFTTKKDGSGIGMMTIKTIVEKDLGSTIEVKSEIGKGAEFIIKIPIL